MGTVDLANQLTNFFVSSKMVKNTEFWQLTHKFHRKLSPIDDYLSIPKNIELEEIEPKLSMQ